MTLTPGDTCELLPECIARPARLRIGGMKRLRHDPTSVERPGALIEPLQLGRECNPEVALDIHERLDAKSIADERGESFGSRSQSANANIPRNSGIARSRPSAAIVSRATSVSEWPLQATPRPCRSRSARKFGGIVNLAVVGDAIATRLRPHWLTPLPH